MFKSILFLMLFCIFAALGVAANPPELFKIDVAIGAPPTAIKTCSTVIKSCSNSVVAPAPTSVAEKVKIPESISDQIPAPGTAFQTQVPAPSIAFTQLRKRNSSRLIFTPGINQVSPTIFIRKKWTWTKPIHLFHISSPKQ